MSLRGEINRIKRAVAKLPPPPSVQKRKVVDCILLMDLASGFCPGAEPGEDAVKWAERRWRELAQEMGAKPEEPLANRCRALLRAYRRKGR